MRLPQLFVLIALSTAFLSCSRDEPTIVAPPVQPTIVKMNELYARGVAGNLDWVEIYNESTFPVDISGYKIYDSGGQSGTKPKKGIPAGTSVPARGFYVIVTDSNTSDAVQDGFGLSSGGEQVWLEDAAGTIIDTVTFLPHTEYQSYGRNPDGGTWQVLNTMTRGTANNPGSGAIIIKMNELYARGVVPSNPDWVEIYNESTTQVDLSGYKIYDSGGQSGTKPKKEFPAGTTIPARGLYVIVTDVDTSPSIADGFGLSSGGEKVWLEDATGAVADTVTFLPHTETQSYGRIPDGGTWGVRDVITRGTPNQ